MPLESISTEANQQSSSGSLKATCITDASGLFSCTETAMIGILTCSSTNLLAIPALFLETATPRLPSSVDSMAGIRLVKGTTVMNSNGEAAMWRESMFLRCWMSLSIAIGTSLSAMADDDGAIHVVPVQYNNVENLLKSLQGALDGDDVRITSDVETNLLMLKGSKVGVEKAKQLLQVLDRAGTERAKQLPKVRDQSPKMVTINVEIEVIDPRDRNAPKIVDSFQLVTLENNTATAQLGQQVSVVRGTQSFGGGRPTVRSMESRATGSVLKATPRVRGDSIDLEFNVEKSWLEYAAADEEEREDFDKPTTYTLSLQTAVRIAEGGSQTVKVAVSGGQSAREAVITISAGTSAKATSSGDVQRRAPSAGSRSLDAQRSRGGQSRGGQSRTGGRSNLPGGRGGIGERSDGRTGVDLGAMAARLYEQLDRNKDGEIDDSEREKNARLLQSMGFAGTEAVTVEKLAEKMQKRGEARSSKSVEPKPSAEEE